MFFFLPDEKDGLPNLIKILNSKPGFFNKQFNLWWEMISDFWIPRFKFSFDFEASETIKEMGLQRPFYPGELREMVHSSNNESSIFQKSSRNHVLKLMRKGSKLLLQSVSAAATKRKTCAPYPAPSFVADHLFMFMIREAATRTVFFAGAVLNPLIMSWLHW